MTVTEPLAGYDGPDTDGRRKPESLYGAATIWDRRAMFSRIGVDEGGGQLGNGVGEFVFGVVGDAVSLREVQGGVDVEFGIGVQAVSDSAHPHAAYRLHAGPGRQGLFGGIDHRWVDAVEQAAEHISRGSS